MRQQAVRCLCIALSLLWFSGCTGRPLVHDNRYLKTRCCDDDAQCSFLPLGQNLCPEGQHNNYDDELRCPGSLTPCAHMHHALRLMVQGGIMDVECFDALREAKTGMPFDPAASGDAELNEIGRKAASLVRNNLGIAMLVGRWENELAPSEPLQRMRAAHRLFTAAILLDPGSDAAASNLASVGGRGACADLADGGEPDWNAPCEPIPVYHARMLHDQTRNAAYASGIRAALANRPGARVLEVGAGSGIFSVLAAKFGASHVTGYEMLLPVAAAAARAFATNGLYPDCVMLAPIRSSAAPTPPREALADIVVHEVFDPMLLGEGVAPSLRDAAQRLAAPGAIFVPSRATVFVHAFCSDNIAALRWPPLGPLPPLEPKDPSSLSSPSRASCSPPSSPSRPAFNARSVSGPPQFYLGIVEAFAAAAFGPREASVMELQHVGGTFPLTARAQVLALNFSDVDSLGTASGDVRRTTLDATVEAHGRLHAVAVTFDAEFPGGSLSTAPWFPPSSHGEGKSTTAAPDEFSDGGEDSFVSQELPMGEAPTHWGQQVFFVAAREEVWPGDELSFVLFSSDRGLQVAAASVKHRGPVAAAAIKNRGGASVQWTPPVALQVPVLAECGRIELEQHEAGALLAWCDSHDAGSLVQDDPSQSELGQEEECFGWAGARARRASQELELAREYLAAGDEGGANRALVEAAREGFAAAGHALAAAALQEQERWEAADHQVAHALEALEKTHEARGWHNSDAAAHDHDESVTGEGEMGDVGDLLTIRSLLDAGLALHRSRITSAQARSRTLFAEAAQLTQMLGSNVLSLVAARKLAMCAQGLAGTAHVEYALEMEGNVSREQLYTGQKFLIDAKALALREGDTASGWLGTLYASVHAAHLVAENALENLPTLDAMEWSAALLESYRARASPVESKGNSKIDAGLPRSASLELCLTVAHNLQWWQMPASTSRRFSELLASLNDAVWRRAFSEALRDVEARSVLLQSLTGEFQAHEGVASGQWSGIVLGAGTGYLAVAAAAAGAASVLACEENDGVSILARASAAMSSGGERIRTVKASGGRCSWPESLPKSACLPTLAVIHDLLGSAASMAKRSTLNPALATIRAALAAAAAACEEAGFVRARTVIVVPSAARIVVQLMNSPSAAADQSPPGEVLGVDISAMSASATPFELLDASPSQVPCWPLSERTPALLWNFTEQNTDEALPNDGLDVVVRVAVTVSGVAHAVRLSRDLLFAGGTHFDGGGQRADAPEEPHPLFLLPQALRVRVGDALVLVLRHGSSGFSLSFEAHERPSLDAL